MAGASQREANKVVDGFAQDPFCENWTGQQSLSTGHRLNYPTQIAPDRPMPPLETGWIARKQGAFPP